MTIFVGINRNRENESMSPLAVIITIVAYFAVLFVVSYWAGHQADNAGFFQGGRQSKWYVVAFAMIGASISGVTYVSVPGMVGASQFGYLQLIMGFMVGQLVIAFVLTPLYYKMQLVSVYQFLEQRLGFNSYHTGAWFFFISKMLGASVRLYLVCLTFQLLIFDPLHLPFVLNVAVSVLIVWLYTFRGGVKSLIWTDSLKTLCLIVSVVLCIWFIAQSLGMKWGEMLAAISDDRWSRVFFFDDVNNRQYFWKQFLAGVFTQIAMNGIDQDMMQRNLSCRNSKESQMNMMVSMAMQFVVIGAFLMLGALLYIFAEQQGITVEKSDTLFPLIATGGYLPLIVGILFIIGLTSSAFSAAGSALTALTTSFTVDILGVKGKAEEAVKETRQRVHMGMAVVMALSIVVFHLLNNTSVIDAVYILASYTYGPILGMFAFGILTKWKVRDRLIPLVAVLAPLLCFVLDKNSVTWFNGYHFSYEILILNVVFTFLGLCLIKK